MKKSLLFIMPSLVSGGAEKSLITLLSMLDSEKYDIDLLLFRREGLFLRNVPDSVHIVDGGEKYSIFDGSAGAAIKRSLKRFDWRFALNRIKYSRALSSGDRAGVWNALKKALPSLQSHYDAAIGYLEGNALYYCAECADADIKIGYIHNDYNKLGLDPDFDRAFVDRLDFLVSVSAECSHVLCEVFPEAKGKIRTVENISSPALLKKLADEGVPEYEGVACLKLLTVGRLREQKGYDMALDAAEKLMHDGVDFKWFSIGSGEQREQIEKTIKEKQLSDRFVLLGERANPYPYIAGCDIYVQPSRFEGKSIAIDEAKCLHKPIVATKFTTVFDQLADEKTALLAEIDGGDISEKLRRLISDSELRTRLSENLLAQSCGNEDEINKFYALLEGEK